MSLASTHCRDTPPQIAGEQPATLFQEKWRTYRKMVDNNYLFHREAYERLRRVLIDELRTPFRFLDVACGDASATVQALEGTFVERYYGIDLSSTALQLAAKNLRALACSVDLREGDFVDALRAWREPVDVVWIGLSLHHMLAAAKLDVMCEVRRIVGGNGLFLVYENAGPDGEDREQWLRRWDMQKPHWSAYTPEEWARVRAHVHAADFPETNSTWLRLARDAGFNAVGEIFAAPTDLFRMYLFRVA
jgi:SAM-dependent methyltransferase